MLPLTTLYPNLVTKETLLTPQELAPFKNFSSQVKSFKTSKVEVAALKSYQKMVFYLVLASIKSRKLKRKPNCTHPKVIKGFSLFVALFCS